MTTELYNHITIDTVSSFFSEEIHVDVLRLDKIHPVISGNKWFKLRYYLEEAREKNKTHIITFGGAWSNHIVACAAACKAVGLLCTGIIRGQEPSSYSKTLLEAKAYGMQLIFISREEYKEKIIPGSIYHDDCYIIPEGGYGTIGAKGAATILDYCDKNYTHYCCAVGTGTMIAGLINSSNSKTTGIPVLKNNHQLKQDIESLINHPHPEWELIPDYHFGGYAKYNQQLLAFMNDFYRHTAIPTDFVYTGKLVFGIHDLVTKNFFASGSRLLIIHSGGLQGNTSLAPDTLLF